MDFSIKYASQMMISTVLCGIFLFGLVNFAQHFQYQELESASTFPTPSIYSHHIELVVDKIALKLNQQYQLGTLVKAYDDKDGDISERVEIYHNINIHQKGYYQARFVVKNSSGQWVDKIVDVRVDE